ncbi:MAG: phosphatase PAP2 family protein [Actinobacteria bacterium]|nr:phosphatase PAP2 family protein [Actinomycetota bacterium]
MPRTPRSAALAALCFALAIPILAVCAYYVVPLRLAEAHVFDWLSSLEYTTPTSYQYTVYGHVARAITFFAEPVPLLIVVSLGCAYAFVRRRPADALAGVVVVGGANLTTQILKHVFAHDRAEPFLAHVPDLTTFPSGHVTGAASMVLALIWAADPGRRRVAAWAGTTYLFLVGVSVLVLEWHFPSDVLGALAVTGAWGFGVLAVRLWSAGRKPPPSGRRAGSRPVADQLDDLGHDLVDVEVLRRVDAGDPGRP